MSSEEEKEREPKESRRVTQINKIMLDNNDQYNVGIWINEKINP